MLRFVDKQRVSSVDQLTQVEREQLRVAGESYDGQLLPAADRLGDGGFRDCELWRILDGDRHAFDAWLYMGDSGTIFRAGTTDRVAEIVKCGLECSDRWLRAEIGPAMVEARLLPERDASFGEFAEMLAKQRAGVVLAPILAEGTMPASPHALANVGGLREVSREELAEIVAVEIAPEATKRGKLGTAARKSSSRPAKASRPTANKASANKTAAKNAMAKKATSKKPTAKPPTAKKPTAKHRVAKARATKRSPPAKPPSERSTKTRR